MKKILKISKHVEKDTAYNFNEAIISKQAVIEIAQLWLELES